MTATPFGEDFFFERMAIPKWSWTRTLRTRLVASRRSHFGLLYLLAVYSIVRQDGN